MFIKLPNGDGVEASTITSVRVRPEHAPALESMRILPPTLVVGTTGPNFEIEAETTEEVMAWRAEIIAQRVECEEAESETQNEAIARGIRQGFDTLAVGLIPEARRISKAAEALLRSWGPGKRPLGNKALAIMLVEAVKEGLAARGE